LRDTAAWAARALGIEITADGLGYRFTCAVCFLRAVVQVPARLILAPLPPEKAARARQKQRRAAAKRSHHPDELALKLAGYSCFITSVPADRLPPDVLLSWYRVRWQIELWFKRCKSLLGLDRLTKASPPLIAIQIWGRLLVALLTERLQPVPFEEPPDRGRQPISAWRLTRMHWLDVVLAVYGSASLSSRLENRAALEHLREHHRKRTVDAGLSREIEQILRASQPSMVPR
jgi:hypothetical protein